MRRMSVLIAKSEERIRKIEQDGYDALYTAEVQNYMESKPYGSTGKHHAYSNARCT